MEEADQSNKKIEFKYKYESKAEEPSPSDFNVDSFESLVKVEKGIRDKCPKCDHARKFYCHTCHLPLVVVPIVELPLAVDIIQHPKETKAKSTAAHAKVLSPEYVNIYEFPNIPDYDSIHDEVVLLFPSPKAEYIEDMDVSKIKRLIVVDSTWQTTNQILRDPKFERVRHCKIKPHKTLFWRYQCISEEYVSTIEATYYFVNEYHQALNKQSTDKYDNLLWLFLYFYHKIQQSYISDPTKVYTNRKVGDYIKYNKNDSQ